MILEIIAILGVKQGLEGLNERMKKDQERKEKIARQQRRKQWGKQ